MLNKEHIEQVIRGDKPAFKPFRPGYGEFLTGKRIENGLTMKKLAEMAGVSERSILNIEKENMKGYSHHDLRCCLRALGLHYSDIEVEE